MQPPLVKIGRTSQTSKEPFPSLKAKKFSPLLSIALLTLNNNIVLIKHCFHHREKQNLICILQLVHFACIYSSFNSNKAPTTFKTALITGTLPMLSGCLPKILITQIGRKIHILQILCVNCTLSGYFKNTFRLGSKCSLRQCTRGVPWWTKMDILLVQKGQFSITLVTPHNT